MACDVIMTRVGRHHDITPLQPRSSIMAAVSQKEQRAYIKIEYLRRKTWKEIHESLCEACGGSAVSDDQCSGRPIEVTELDILKKLRKF